MTDSIKIIIGGLDAAGKTSILTALNKKYDFHQDIMELKPTIKVEYNTMNFLDNDVYFWDMGGQEKYRNLYEKRKEVYFSDTDLLVYIIDIQNKERFEESLDYLDLILDYFIKTNSDVPLIIAFHKYDPEVRGDEDLNNRISELREQIFQKYNMFQILFQLTSIFDVLSIIQLISYGLSVFDPKFFDLSELLEHYQEEFDCQSLILLDENGIIISEFYSNRITPDIYAGVLEMIKEHLFLLKRIQEENYKKIHDFSSIEDHILSYLHRIQLNGDDYFISILVDEKKKDHFMEKFSDFVMELTHIMEELA